MTKRVISALIGAPLLLIITWHGGWYLAILVSVLALLALKEYLRLGELAGWTSNWKIPMLFSVLWIVVFLFGQKVWLLALGLLWVIGIFGWFGLSYPKVSFAEASYLALALFYPVTLFTFLFYLRDLPQGLYWCLYVFLVVWVTDTGAFFVGSALSKHKLAPTVSPNKSVEGSIGGLIASTSLGVVFWWTTQMGTLLEVVLLSLVVSVVSQIGDLFESALKRSAKVKDSGNIIPGHGGILDRFDSFLFALPVVYFAYYLGLVG